MSSEDIIPSDEEIMFLPETPVIYLSIMRTKEGKPLGIPIWSSFDNRSEERSMQNESMASTFLSLSKSMSEMTDDPEEDGKVIRLNVNNKTYNIYMPHPADEMQVCFVVVFEESERVLVKDEYKVELVRLVTKSLRKTSGFKEFLNDDSNIKLTKEDDLYRKVFDNIVDNIKSWDKKRVKRIKLKKEEEQKRLEEERKKQEALRQIEEEERRENEANDQDTSPIDGSETDETDPMN